MTGSRPRVTVFRVMNTRRGSIVACVVACIFAIVALTGGGCAKYEYNLVKPSELQRHIGTGSDAVVRVDPLEYRLRTVDNRLVVRIFNPTEDQIELVGPRCSVVDPDGQSHPLRTQSIAPGSFIKLILPPPRPEVYGPGPMIGFGVGYQVNAYPYPCYPPPPYFGPYAPYAAYGPYYDPYFFGPRYLAVYDENDAYYWDWHGEGESRAILTFRRGDKEFRHELVFRRQKM